MTRHGLFALPPTPADLWLARRAARAASPSLERAAQVVTLAADENLLLGVVGLMWIGVRLLTQDAGTRERADHLALVTAASAALPHLLKQLVDQERPDRRVVGEPRHGVPRSGKPRNAFPSGHAVHLGAIAAALTRWVSAPWGLAVWAVALGLSATRLVLLAHWLTDVAAGLAIGVGLEAALHRLRAPDRSGPVPAWATDPDGSGRPQAPTRRRGVLPPAAEQVSQ
jgi:membrane-associated phospholipid phosphatase